MQQIMINCNFLLDFIMWKTRRRTYRPPAYQNNFPIEQIRLFSGLNENAILEILKRNN
jgi:hypothetical protein